MIFIGFTGFVGLVGSLPELNCLGKLIPAPWLKRTFMRFHAPRLFTIIDYSHLHHGWKIFEIPYH